jgi:hypothetical protein
VIKRKSGRCHLAQTCADGSAQPNRREICCGEILHAIRNLSLRRKAAFVGVKFSGRRRCGAVYGNVDSGNPIGAYG